MKNIRPRRPLEGPRHGEYFGVYQGYIRDVDDPDTKGRIRCYCPEVMGALDDVDHWLDWAWPSFPWVVNQGVGLASGSGFLPPAAQPQQDKWGVWLQFRQGDPRFPIWTGVFPLQALTNDITVEAKSVMTLKAGSQSVVIDDGAGAVNVNGSTYHMPQWDTFITDLNTFVNAVSVTPPAVNPATTMAAVVALQTAAVNFVASIAAALSYKSTKAKNG